jgi:outer membrane protein assembly factor BamD (BamD/ComL family)
MGDDKSERKALQQLVKQFPDSTAAATAKDRLASLKTPVKSTSKKK